MVAAAVTPTGGGAPPPSGAASSSSDSDSTPPLHADGASTPGDRSLIIPITSTGRKPTDIDADPDLHIEIFPEELPDVPPSVLARVLIDEDAPLSVWTDAALIYVRRKRESECSDLLSEACELERTRGFQNREKVRTLASAGIAALTGVNRGSGPEGADAALEAILNRSSGEGGGGGKDGGGGGGGPAPGEKGSSSDRDEELRAAADDRFTRAGKVDQLFPMTWVGRGMLNLSLGRLDQARFFFDTTLRQCGQVLPALLGMAAVRYREEDYSGAQEMYGRAMTLFPERSGGATRVGFGLACYRLGQIDRAKAAFKRAHAMDPENVEAMIGLAILEMASLDETAKDFRQRSENAIKLISMANLIDHSSAVVQNHLANHCFWKWAPVPGTVEVRPGSNVVRGSQPMNLDAGERIRIGQDFETTVVEEEGGGDLDADSFRIKDVWKGHSSSTTAGLKLWKKDYDRVIALAKGAYGSTTVKEIQAESLFHLARVYHIRDEMESASKFYDKACKLAPNLSPARFGLAQSLIWDDKYDEAAAHLRLVLGSSPNATDSLAALGLLEVKTGKDRSKAFASLKKAIDLDPLNPDLVLLEALALQQREADFPQSLERYQKAVRLMEGQRRPVPYEVLTNMGVLCHETRKYDDALANYRRALRALDGDGGDVGPPGLDDEGGNLIRHKDNSLFWNYVDAGVRLSPSKDDGRVLTVAEENGAASLPGGVKVGDHVRLGEAFETEIADIRSDGGGDRNKIYIKRAYVPPPKDSEGETDGGDTGTDETPLPLYVKRTNCRLSNPPAVSVAFNLARLHEAAGRTVPSVELHKAIVGRHPSYVNSYLRLACIARDCGSLKDCSEWLKSAVAVAPGNHEVLTLVGNLHLSLCDWAPAQGVFDQLLQQKASDVEAYSMLSLGNIYFNNLKTPKKYTKHLGYAADFYKRILTRDKANAYAANGLGTVLAEKGELDKAKEVFNRVREVSGDAIPDALLNLGHIYLAQKRHPEAVRMYQSYMNRTRGAAANITSKSRDDDDSQVLLFIAFAYFDWARITELFNNAKAAPADERYKKCVEYIELAMKKSKKENVVLRYNWCMTKLQAANCVLQKLTRNIRRTAQEVQDALDGLEEALPIVQTLIQWKNEGKKVPIATSTLNDFVSHCRHNIDSAKSHLQEERKKEKEAQELRELQRIEAEAQQKQREIQLTMEKERAEREEEKRDKRAKDKMMKVSSLVANWEQEAEAIKQAAETKKQKAAVQAAPGVVEEDEDAHIFDDDVAPEHSTAALFDDNEDEDEDSDKGGTAERGSKERGSKENVERERRAEAEKTPVETEKSLFGASTDEESDEELVPDSSSKRGAAEAGGGGDEGHTSKKRRVLDDEED